MTKILIVVDVQNDFCEGGALPIEGGREIAARINDYIAEQAKTSNEYDRIYASKDWHIEPGPHFYHAYDSPEGWPVHCIPNTWGSEFAPELLPYANPIDTLDAVFYKGQYSDGYSALSGTLDRAGESEFTLLGRIRDLYSRELEVDVCGLALDHCVRATALGTKLYLKDATVRVLRKLTKAADPNSIPDIVDEFDAAGIEWVE